jgi:hypothetical protein
MSITRGQVADLQRGDVVELRWPNHPDVVVSGPLRPRGGGQWVGPVPVIGPSGEMHDGIDLTVVSRAPRPLYVNHPRTEPVPGDVVRDADGNAGVTWVLADTDRRPWISPALETWVKQEELPARLRLLVDGETGMTVPS